MTVCKNPACKQKFKSERPFQKGCCHECEFEIAMIAVRKKREQDARKANQAKVAAEKSKRQELRNRKEALKTRNEWVADVQREFNKFIRLRDHDQPCISCGTINPPALHGGQWDCGHYLSVGSHPELRFDELNAHRQCKSCNAGAGKYAHKNKTVTEQYRENLIQKIGLDSVERLEGPHEPKKYTIDQLKALKAHYKAKQKQLSTDTEHGSC